MNEFLIYMKKLKERCHGGPNLMRVQASAGQETESFDCLSGRSDDAADVFVNDGKTFLCSAFGQRVNTFFAAMNCFKLF